LLSEAALGAIRRAYEVTLLLVFVASAARSWRTRGAAVTSREMVFGFALSQSVELLAVARGRYRYPDWLVYFPPHPAWVPLGVGLGWAALVPPVMRLSERLLGTQASRWRLAALDGVLAMSLDLVLDPIVSNDPLRMWMWRGDGMTAYRYWLLDVPVFNFVGWFLLIGATGLQLRTVEARADGRRWGALATFVALDLAIAAIVMSLPW
jgi:uncharacterized membrane protein